MGAGFVGPQREVVRWRRSLGEAIVAGPVITAAGQAYVASTTGILHAVDTPRGVLTSLQSVAGARAAAVEAGVGDRLR